MAFRGTRCSLTMLVAIALAASACGDSTTVASTTDSGGATPDATFSAQGAPAVDPALEAEPVDSALRGDRANDGFPAPLVEVSDIVSGGPPPDGIPPIDDPRFRSIADVDYLGEDEAVIVVEVNGEAKAYPVQILIWHEIVNDSFGDLPVTVTYCPLCNSALAFDRRLGERVLSFGTSGELYQSALVMYDRETESLWAHFTGQAIVGHYAGVELARVPAQTISWAQFTESFPEGQVLDIDTGVDRPYGSNPYVGYDDVASDPIGGFISQPIDDQFASKDRIVGVEGDAGSFALPLDVVAADGALEFDDGDRTLVAFHEDGLASALDASGIGDGRDVGQTGVFVAADPNGSKLSFDVTDDGFVDTETRSTWNITGQATSGPLEGVTLDAVPHVDTFWFAWATYRPDSELISG